MSATTPQSAVNRDGTFDHQPRRLTTETKASVKTSELVAYVAVVVLVAITALVVGDGDSGGSTADPFSANDALRYITYLPSAT